MRLKRFFVASKERIDWDPFSIDEFSVSEID
jgi:hypothetical protein